MSRLCHADMLHCILYHLTLCTSRPVDDSWVRLVQGERLKKDPLVVEGKKGFGPGCWDYSIRYDIDRYSISVY